MKKPETTRPPTVALAMLVAFVLAAGLIAMTAVILPGVLLMVVAGFGLMIFFVAQYFLWARWMFPIMQRWEQEKSSREDLKAADDQKPDRSLPGV